jgi:hypothetical protein
MYHMADTRWQTPPAGDLEWVISLKNQSIEKALHLALCTTSQYLLFLARNSRAPLRSPCSSYLRCLPPRLHPCLPLFALLPSLRTMLASPPQHVNLLMPRKKKRSSARFQIF